MARVRADEAVFTDADRWRGLDADGLVGQAVREVARIFTRHAAFLRSVVLVSGAHPEVYRRGVGYSTELGDLFAGVLLRARDQMDPEGAVRSAFTSVFSTFVVRVAYGPAIAVGEVDGDAFVESLSTMVSRYLLRPKAC